MDEARAKRIANELKGNTVGDWTILDYINHGKSAVVLKAIKDKDYAAVKVFDQVLIERFGQETQLKRVEREKTLIGKSHPHLISILDGGICCRSGNIFIAMAYLQQKNLKELIDKIPRDKIALIIHQIASAAKFLEEIGLAHRDIKPENIVLSDDFSHATLLDTGVVRTVGFSEITDENEQKVFIGTLRYSPPELLYRDEEDTVEGWQSVSFYQLGAVLHDLIMQHPIFHDISEPYAKLANAVRKTAPEIKASDIDMSLIMLARSCLVKDPLKRRSLVSWDHFLCPASSENNVKNIEERIRRRNEINQYAIEEASKNDIGDIKFKKGKEFQKVINEIKESLRTICVNNSTCLPTHDIIKIIKSNGLEAEILLCFESSTSHNMLVGLTLLIHIAYTDILDNIVKIDYAACASKTCPAPVESLSSNFRKMFEGPYEITAIKDILYHLLLRLVDTVQELKIDDVGDFYIDVSIT